MQKGNSTNSHHCSPGLFWPFTKSAGSQPATPRGLSSNTIRIGEGVQTATYIAGISGATVPGGVTVIVDSNGHLGAMVSSQRFKDEIKPMGEASEAILALKPVTFRYKQELDPKGIPQFGLVAEDMEKVNPDLVVRDKEGKPYSVRYDAVNAMLLNEFRQTRGTASNHCRPKVNRRATAEKLSVQALGTREANRGSGIGSCEGERAA